MVKRAVIVVGLGFGDEGKGTVVDAVTREIGATLVVRFNGGPQAAHRVVLEDGRSHVFSQFGSGFFAAASTFISRFCSIEPFAFMNEADALEHECGVRDPFLAAPVWIDKDAPVITPYHRAYNRLLEWSRGENRHGSCGMGVGALAEDLAARPFDPGILRASDLQYADVVEEKLRYAYALKHEAVLRLIPLLPRNVLDVDTELDLFRPWDVSARDRLSRWVARYERFTRKATILTAPVQFSGHQNIVFEGAQGVLLDQTHGFAPYHTWSDCTPMNAVHLLRFTDHKVTTIGVTRTYGTRHGAGPFPTEDRRVWNQIHPEAANHGHPYQGEFRVGHLDAVLLRYAIAACNGFVHGLAVTHVDAPFKQIGMATAYGYFRDERLVCLAEHLKSMLPSLTPHYRGYVGENRMANLLRGIEMETQRPILLESHGATAGAKRWTPAWRELLDGKAVSA